MPNDMEEIDSSFHQFAKPRGVWSLAHSMFADDDKSVLEVLSDEAKAQ